MSGNGTRMDAAYWVGHAVVIVSTVLGVFLAASVGYSKAVELELLKSDRDTFYLAQSFHQEVTTNTDRVDAFAKEFKHGFYDPDFHAIKVNKYVFETMRFAGSTFELKPEVLNGVSEYYLEVEKLINALNKKKLGKAFAMDKLTEATAKLRDSHLGTLGGDVQALKDKLLAQDVTP